MEIKNPKSRATSLLGTQEQNPKNEIIGAVTIILKSDFSCDFLEISNIDGIEIPFDTNLLGTFKSFMEEVSTGIVFAEIMRKFVTVGTNNAEPN